MKTNRSWTALLVAVALVASCEDDGGGPDPMIDSTAPARVTDLTAVTATPLGITLAWTATGDDGSTGTAAGYQLRESHAAITSANWDDATAIALGTPPGPAGTLESFTFTGFDTMYVHYFALRATDESNNRSEVSNNAIWMPRGGTVKYVVDMPAYRDNTMYEESDGLSNAKGQHLFSGLNNKPALDARRGLLAFAIADSIPAGAIVDSVALVLNLSRKAPFVAGDVAVSVHQVLNSWGEGTSIADLGSGEGGGGTATPGDATWLDRFRGTSQWTNAGGDYASVASATAQTNGLIKYTWTTSTMVVDVQEWLDTPATNFGWILIANESSTAGNARQWDSRENTTAANRPRLTVFYTVTP